MHSIGGVIDANGRMSGYGTHAAQLQHNFLAYFANLIRAPRRGVYYPLIARTRVTTSGHASKGLEVLVCELECTNINHPKHNH